MILAIARAGLAGSALLMAASPAAADVLEVSADGHRWIAGGAEPEVVPAEITPVVLAEVPADLAVTPEVISNPQLNTATLPDAYRAKVLELSARYDVSPTLIEALVWQESRWRQNAVSPKGARGLAQLMPGTAREMGVDASDPLANLEGGVRYLRAQLDRFDGDIEKALAAYNAGPGRVERADGVPQIRETQQYVAAITGRLSDHSR